jgi:hypothetical protein
MRREVTRIQLKKTRGVRRLLTALVLGLGLLLLLSSGLEDVAAKRAGESLAPTRTVLTTDPRVMALMNLVNTNTVAAYERALTGEQSVIIAGEPYTLVTRHSYSGEPISQATRYVYERFQDMGLDVVFHEYTYSARPLRNVVAERRGLLRPDEIYLITAHLDDMPPGALAPGADDNASGSTAVLIAAELLGQLDLDCTLRFVLFTGEEQGLQGSAVYAGDIAAAGDDVRGVINLDMIGYNSDEDPEIDLHARSAIPASLVLAETFSQVIAAYDLNLIPDILVNIWQGDYSDNKSFWDQGYSAILAIEDDDDFSPYYHKTGDTLDTLDLEYMTEFVRAGVGALAHLAHVADTGTLTGAVTNGATGLPLSSTVMAVALDRVYTTTSGAGGYYSLTLPAYTFTLYAQANMANYQSAVVTNVVVLANGTTVQALVIEPWLYRLFMPIIEIDA